MASRTALAPWALTILTVFGCASSPSQPESSPPTERVSMEPIQFVARKTEAGVVVESRDAAGLFQKGAQAYQEGRFANAIEAYELLLKEFPDSTYVNPSRYNLGLSYEKAKRYADAVRIYRYVAAQAGATRDGRDALFRVGSCHEALAQWEQIKQVMDELLRRSDLTEDDRVEAQIRRSLSLIELDQLDEAEYELRRILRGQKTTPPRPLLSAFQLLAHAQFGLARIEHTRFSRAPIRLPQAVMEADVQEKARIFLRAQAAYLRTMGHKDRHWSSRSGLKIGQLYEELYVDLMEAPVPPELNAEETEIYFEELRKTIRPLIKRAVYVYEKNIRLAERLGEEATVLAETRARLDRLRGYLDGKVSTPVRAQPENPTEEPTSETEPDVTTTNSAAEPPSPGSDPGAAGPGSTPSSGPPTNSTTDKPPASSSTKPPATVESGEEPVEEPPPNGGGEG